MQRWVAGLCVCGLLAAGLALAADKDTALAGNTRKKLEVKVTLEHKQEMLVEILKDVKGQLEDAKAGALSWKFDTGVSQNQRLNISVKDKPLKDVLDELFKQNGLGYVVVSKDKDRYDGWLLIKQGNERGYPAGAEPKDKGATPKAKGK